MTAYTLDVHVTNDSVAHVTPLAYGVGHKQGVRVKVSDVTTESNGDTIVYVTFDHEPAALAYAAFQQFRELWDTMDFSLSP